MCSLLPAVRVIDRTAAFVASQPEQLSLSLKGVDDVGEDLPRIARVADAP